MMVLRDVDLSPFLFYCPYVHVTGKVYIYNTIRGFIMYSQCMKYIYYRMYFNTHTCNVPELTSAF